MTDYALQHPYLTFVGFCFLVFAIGLTIETAVNVIWANKSRTPPPEEDE